MQTSKRDGMITFEDSVLALVRQGVVAPEEAMGYGIDPDVLEARGPGRLRPRGRPAGHRRPVGARTARERTERHAGSVHRREGKEDDPNRPGSLASRVSGGSL
jgi:hypothetical protein